METSLENCLKPEIVWLEESFTTFFAVIDNVLIPTFAPLLGILVEIAILLPGLKISLSNPCATRFPTSPLAVCPETSKNLKVLFIPTKTEPEPSSITLNPASVSNLIELTLVAALPTCEFPAANSETFNPNIFPPI